MYLYNNEPLQAWSLDALPERSQENQQKGRWLLCIHIRKWCIPPSLCTRWSPDGWLTRTVTTSLLCIIYIYIILISSHRSQDAKTEILPCQTGTTRKKALGRCLLPRIFLLQEKYRLGTPVIVVNKLSAFSSTYIFKYPNVLNYSSYNYSFFKQLQLFYLQL